MIKRLVILTLVSLLLILLRAFCILSTSDLIYSITAVIIFWYTLETYTIAKAARENQKRFEKPIVGLAVFPHKKVSLDTRVRLINLSNYQIAARLNCVIKINGEILEDFHDAYTGKEYWNLQFKQSKEGHFSIADLLRRKCVISRSEYDLIVAEPNPYRKALEILKKKFGDNLPKITMDIDIFCENKISEPSYYPPVNYEYVIKRKEWIPKLTSPEPFWYFEELPNWVSSNRTVGQKQKQKKSRLC